MADESNSENESAKAVSRLRVSPGTADKVRDFCTRHRTTPDEAVSALITSYDSLRTYRFSGEAAHLMASMESLEATVIVLGQTNLEVVACLRDLQQGDYQALAQQMDESTAQTRRISASSSR